MAELEAGLIGRETEMAEQVSEMTAREIEMAVQETGLLQQEIGMLAQGIAVIGVEVMWGSMHVLSHSIKSVLLINRYWRM